MSSNRNQWLQIKELGYPLPTPPDVTLCFYCSIPLAMMKKKSGPSGSDSAGAEKDLGIPVTSSKSSQSRDPTATTTTKITVRPTLMRCGQCQVAAYCSRECQVNDWKGRPPPSSTTSSASNKRKSHKKACASYRRVGVHQVLLTEQDRQETREAIWLRTRTMACLYAVFKARTVGRGFLFIQSPHSLSYMSLSTNKDVYGRSNTTPRALTIDYLTWAEYAKLCRKDFGLTWLRSELPKAVAEYQERDEVVVLMKFGCGHLALGRLGLDPDYDYQTCQELGPDYFASPAFKKIMSLRFDLDAADDDSDIED